MTGLLITCDIFNMPNNKKNVSYFATCFITKKKTQYEYASLTVIVKATLIIPVTASLPPLPHHTVVISTDWTNTPTASDGFCTRSTIIPYIDNII